MWRLTLMRPAVGVGRTRVTMTHTLDRPMQQQQRPQRAERATTTHSPCAVAHPTRPFVVGRVLAAVRPRVVGAAPAASRTAAATTAGPPTPTPLASTPPFLSWESWLPTLVRGPSLPLATRLRFLLLESASLVGAMQLSNHAAGLSIMVLFGGPTVDPLELITKISSVVMPLSCVTYIAITGVIARKWPSLAIPPPPAHSTSTKWRWTKIGLGLLIGSALLVGTSAFNFLASWTGELGPEREEPILVEITMDAANSKDGWVAAPLAITGPIGEELFFRGLLFARAVRVLGMLPAYVCSSLLFGLVHHSDNSDKVMPAAVSGAFFAAMYQLTKTLMVPVLLHTSNNACQLAMRGAQNPMIPFDAQCDLQLKLLLAGMGSGVDVLSLMTGAVREGRASMLGQPTFVESQLTTSSGEAAEADAFEEVPPVYAMLQPNLTDLQPAVAEYVQSIFRALDRDQKGYLSVEEWAWLAQLQTDRHVHFRNACSIIARRASPIAMRAMTPQQRAQLEADTNTRSQTAALKDIAMLPMPHEMILPSPVAPAPGGLIVPVTTLLPAGHPARKLLTESHLSHLEPVARYESIRARHWTLLAQPLQQQIARQWYSLQHAIDYIRIFQPEQVRWMGRLPYESLASEVPFALDGCTPKQFEAYIIRRILLDPTLSAEWLARAADVINGHQEHPTAAVWKARASHTMPIKYP